MPLHTKFNLVGQSKAVTQGCWSFKVSTGLALVMLLCGCANSPLRQGTSLSSYNNMKPARARLTMATLWVDRTSVLSARTIRIIPTTISDATVQAIKQPEDRALIANTINRALCVDLSDRFKVVSPVEAADLTIRASIVDIMPTNSTAAGLSTVTSLGTAIVLPVSMPRLPIGLGGLSVEAEAIGADGQQKAAMLWSRGANSFTNKPRVSQVGDAYSLANTFGDDFGKMLVTGQSPFGILPSIPSGQKLRASLGGKNKYEACNAFGSAPGIAGAIAGQVGMPPAWTDRPSTIIQ
ncbi:DUF3313 domain-containing protein [Rhizobium rhizogenes]|uniref:DUF3313 domain-containing protein n=1 Tax=Rhizobium rhizogenes TaxID=359 RepID=UPI001296AC70|nr:DUF3313 domain-containing protein [Rhizobium rhizogenes]MQB34266.1 DUF3313 family protein [Rhizobium rhizogenes]